MSARIKSLSEKGEVGVTTSRPSDLPSGEIQREPEHVTKAWIWTKTLRPLAMPDLYDMAKLRLLNPSFQRYKRLPPDQTAS